MGTALPTDDGTTDRRRATLYVLPFLTLGLANLVTLLGWGLDPLWAFAILPPILCITLIGWIAFRHDFHDRGRAGGR
ncbi:hypothetical protein [Natrononativus amylolyticus]|uniref:hypothetical protein n=1 Tax=Natrononativus amylolyticus TaxID=2963434 RepID=UPI0020CD3AD2|nr:hypothetical protein [Natrononativus amylolyticus]